MSSRVQIKGKQIKDGTITTDDIADDTLTGVDIDESTLIITKLRDQDNDTKIEVEQTSDDDTIRFDTAGNPRVIIDNLGKVGIGIGNPSSQLHIANSTTDDLLFLETTENSNSASPVIKLKRNSTSPANADYIGQIKFQGENNADQNVTYAKITAKIGSVTDGAEQGIIEFANMKNGSSGITARLRHDSLQLLNNTNLSVDGTTEISEYLYHKDDNDTYMHFTDGRIRFNAGGINMFGMHNKDLSQNPSHQVTVNNDANNVDFVIKDAGGNIYFRGDASTGRVGIGTETPEVPLHVMGNASINGHLGVGTSNPRAPIHVEVSNGAGDVHLASNSSNINQSEGLGNIFFVGTLDGGNNYKQGAAIHAFAAQNWNAAGNNFSTSMSFKTCSGNTLATKMTLDSDGDLCVGTMVANEKLTVEGALSLKEMSAINSIANGYGKLYVDSSDSALKFLNDSGTTYNLLSTDGVWSTGTSSFSDCANTASPITRIVIGDTVSSFSATPLQVVRNSGGAGISAAGSHLLLHRKTVNIGDEVSLGFYISDNSSNSQATPGASIHHERLGNWSYGSLNFSTKSSASSTGDCDVRMKIMPTGQVGIGYNSSTREEPITQGTAVNVGQLSVHSHSSDANSGPALNFSRYDSAISDGHNIGEIYFYSSENNTDYASTGYIICESAVTFSPGDFATRMKFGITKRSQGSASDILILEGGGGATSQARVSIGTNDSQAKLNVVGSKGDAWVFKARGNQDDDVLVANFVNDNTSNDADGIGIQIGPNSHSNNQFSIYNSFIKFKDGDGDNMGVIRAKQSGDVELVNAFTGTHPVAILDGTYEIGQIIETTGEMWVKIATNISDSFPYVQLSQSNNSKKVFGVIACMSWRAEKNPWLGILKHNPMKDTHKLAQCNSIGEGCILVTNINGNIENGDYITSSEILGLGRKQDDDILRNYTVAKCIEDIDWETIVDTIEHEGQSYKKCLVACTYHCA